MKLRMAKSVAFTMDEVTADSDSRAQDRLNWPGNAGHQASFYAALMFLVLAAYSTITSCFNELSTYMTGAS